MRGLITRGKTVVSVVFLLFASMLCIGQTTPPQVAKNQTFITNYWDYEALDINPANLAANRRLNKKVSLGLMSGSFLMFNPTLKRDLIHGGGVARLADPAHWFDDILIDRTYMGMDNTILGINFNTRKAGSFGLSVKNKVLAEVELNGAFEDLDFEGTSFSNLPEVIMSTIQENPDNLPPGETSIVRMNVLNEFNLGYSRGVLNSRMGKVKLYVGGGVKYVMGFADVGIEFTSHQVAGYYSLSSLVPDMFGGDSTIAQTQSAKKFSHGFGTSLGATLKMNKFRTSLSVVDIGFIKWPVKDIYFTKEDAAGEVISEEDIREAIGNTIRDFQRDADGKERLPTKLLLGTSYDVHKYVSFYFDLIAPLNDSPRALSRPIAGVGTWLSAKDILTLKTGATFLDKKLVAIPVYLSLFGGKKKTFELSVGTSDMLAFFLANRGYMQAETALMKFHF